MARIALVTPNFTDGDAVSNDVLGMRAVLADRGHTVEVHAAVATCTVAPARPLAALRRTLRDPAAIVIYHHSTGWSGLPAVLAGARCRRVVKYHNVTPPEFFAGVSQEHVLSCRAGREQLGQLARAGLDLYLADSDYNRRELVAAGAPEVHVVAPFHQADRLAAVEPDRDLYHRLRRGAPNLLVVGRLAPNKGHLTLLEAFAHYRATGREGRLVIVGRPDPGLVIYTEVLHARVAALGLGDSVLFTGAVDDRGLRASYEAADVFVIASEHEGFCVPLVEAMALGVPVVALGSTAVPETVGAAGITWEENDPELLAETVVRVVDDAAVRSALRARGRRCYEERFTNATIERDLMTALGPLLAA